MSMWTEMEEEFERKLKKVTLKAYLEGYEDGKEHPRKLNVNQGETVTKYVPKGGGSGC